MEHIIAKRNKRINAVSLPSEVVMHVILAAFSLSCIIPFIFIIIISFTSQESLWANGYSFFPTSWSLISYETAFKMGGLLWRSYFNSILITVVGTALSVLVCILYSYGMFRPDYPYRNFFAFFAFFTMMFGGGLAPTVMVCRNLLGLSDNYAALIVPIMVNPFLFIVMRTFFKTSIPMSLVESASIDGSGEFNTLFRIVVPIAKPGIATVGLLFALAYWNEWFLALVFIRNRDLYPLQYLLMLMQLSVENLKNSIQMVGMSSVNLSEMPTEGLRMAVCVFIVLPIACAYPFFQRYIIAGLTVGAVKE